MSRGPWIKVTIADPTPFTAILPRADLEALQAEAAAAGISVGQLVRDIVAEHRERREAIPYDGSVTGDWPEMGGVEADCGLTPAA